jgi:signal transduction histidine kinase
VEFRLGRRALAVPTLAAVVITAAGAGGFFLTRERARDDARQAFYRSVLPAQAGFSGDVHTSIEDFSHLGTVPAGQAIDAASLGLDAVLRIDTPGPNAARDVLAALRTRGVELSGDDAETAGVVAQALDTALDKGTVRASAPLGSVGGARTLLVLALFRPGATTVTTADRRAALAGYLVGALRPAAVASKDLARITGGTVQVSDGDSALFRLGAARDADAETLDSRLMVAGRSWLISVRADVGSTSTTPGLLLAACLLLAAALLAAGRFLERQEELAARQSQQRESDLSTVAGVGPLLQESLDVAEVLPAASAFLAARFGLEGVSVSYVDDRGRLVEAFTVGRRLAGIPSRPAELRSTPAAVATGEVASVPLLRGGRIIGAIHVLAGEDLTAVRTRTLVTVAEMIGTAVSNARLYEREQETVRRLQELDRLKTEFLGTVSHELRTPITAILGFSQLLHEEFEGIPSEQRRDFVARVARNAASLNTLVQDLLDFSRIGRPSFELHLQEVDLTETTSRILEQFATLVEHHRVLVESPGNVWAFADPEGVERIVSNLLSNAAKFSPPDSVITVAVGHHPDGASLIVDDAGPGVAESERALVFHRFYRGDSTAAVSTRGAGIGLAIVKDLVDRMRGTIEVTAAPSGGARFTVVLPARPQDNTATSDSMQGRNP